MRRDKIKMLKLPWNSVWRSNFRSLILIVPILFIWLFFLGCGSNDNNEVGSNVSPNSNTQQNLVLTGTVRNLTASSKSRSTRDMLDVIGNAEIKLFVDLNEDGDFDPKTELFVTQSNSNGGYYLEVPGISVGKRAELRVEKLGFSTFIRLYQSLQGPIVFDPLLSEGAVTAVDLSGITASPSRGSNEVIISSDEVVTLSLITEGTSNKRVLKRISKNGETSGGEELTRISFPLRGLHISRGVTKLYASVAYLDTVKDPDTMPGGFISEGSGEDPINVLSTYGASQISLYDELGNKLLTDPTDRSRQINIRIAIPYEAYSTLQDEDPSTDEVDIPLFYYDEGSRTWRMHRNEDGTPAYGHLEDSYGNRITQDKLMEIVGEKNSTMILFGVGKVNHFSTWNCDRAGRSVSYHARFRSKDGKPLDGFSTRIRSINGGRSTDVDNRSNSNLHTYRAETAESIIKRVLDRNITPELRSKLLYSIMNSNNPDAIAALIEALQRYEQEQLGDIASEKSDFARGLRAIFQQKEITDAFINPAGLDCRKTPDLCKGVIAAAAEAVNNSKKAKQVTAFLMQIAVDAYNPSNMDFEYAATKGLDFLDIVANTNGVAKELGDIPQQVKSAKDLAKQALDAYKKYKNGTGSWRDYWDLADKLRETVGNIKNLASTLGGRSIKRAYNSINVTRSVPNPQTPEDEEKVVNEITEDVLSSYDEVGGVLFGYSRMRRYKWGYFDTTGQFNIVEDWPNKPTFLGSSSAVMLEYYNGTQWAPINGRSDLGVDASFISVPFVSSYGTGTPQSPAIYLGTWTLDVEPNMLVTGKIETTGGNPLNGIPVIVAGQKLISDNNGNISGKITWLSESNWLPCQIPSVNMWCNARVEEGGVHIDDIRVVDRISINGQKVPWRTSLKRGESIEIKPTRWSNTISGRALSYTYQLYKGYVTNESVPIKETSGDSFEFSVTPEINIGLYTLKVTISVPDDQSIIPKDLYLYIDVQSTPPEIKNFTLDSMQVKAGTPVNVSFDVEDADGPSNIRYKSLSVICNQNKLNVRYITPNLQSNGTWSISTEWAYPALDETIECQVTAYVQDNNWLTTREEKSFTILPNPVPPEVSTGGLDNDYVISLQQVYQNNTWKQAANIWLKGYVWFKDKNRDIDHFELDCGNGTGAILSQNYWEIPSCYYTSPGDYDVTYKILDSKGLEKTLTTTVHVLYPLRFDVNVPEEIVFSQNGTTIVNLPASENASVNITISAISDNGPNGYKEGGGTIAQGSYSVTYRSGNRWWWSETIARGEEIPENGTVPITLDRPGSYSINMWAQDSYGMYARFSKVIEVIAPFDGELQVNEMGIDEFISSGSWVMVGDKMEFSVVNATKGVDLRYRWYVDGSDKGETQDPSFEYSPTTEGNHTVKVEMRNAQETANVHKITRELKFQAYSPLPIDVLNEEGNVDDGLRIRDSVSFKVSIPDGVTISSVKWIIDGPENGFSPVPTNSTLKSSWIFVSSGNYTVKVLVEDDRGVVSEKSYGPFEVIAKPPVINSFVANPMSGSPPLKVNFVVNAEDPDARVGESLSYRWFVDGQPISAGTNNTFNYEFKFEGSHNVKVEVTDESGLTAEETVTVAVRDLPPVISWIHLTPSSGVAPLKIQAQVNATDDNGISKYEWYVDKQKVGEGTTLDYLFSTPGNYNLKCVVTDNKGNSSFKEVTVYVFDPNAATTVFEFKEVRADGLGPLVDFDALADVIQHGGGLWFVYTPLNDATVNQNDLINLKAHMEFQKMGFFGFHGESWGSLSDILVQINIPGNYEVGINTWNSGYNRTVQFPQSYTCGSLVFRDWAQSFGYWGDQQTPLSSSKIYPPISYITKDGKVDVIALLGEWNKENSTCEYKYWGFKGSTQDPIILSNSDSVELKPLLINVPEGLQVSLSDVFILIDGMKLGFGEVHHLPKDSQGRYKIPVIPGADYLFKLGITFSDSYWSVEVPLSGQSVTSDDSDIVLDLSNLQEKSPINISTPVSGSFWVQILNASGIKMISSQNLSDSVNTKTFLSIPNEIGMHIFFDGTNNGDGTGYYQWLSINDIPSEIDLLKPNTNVSVSYPGIEVDSQNKTVTVHYEANGADACVVDLNMEFDTNGDGYADRNRYEHFLSDGKVAQFTVYYPLPESVIEGWEGGDVQSYPATDALSKVTARVNCFRISTDYDSFIRDLLSKGVFLEEASFFGWPPENLREMNTVDEMVWKQKIWKSSQ